MGNGRSWSSFRGGMAVFGAAVLLWSAAGCGDDGPGDGAGSPPAGPVGPAEAFRALEARLLTAPEVEMAFEITAEGAAEIAVEGRLRIADDGTVEVAATGAFAGRPVDLLLAADADSMRFGNAATPAAAPRPPALREALVVGFTRMGLLHNLARLTGDAPPDHGEGGVTEWVEVADFTDPGLAGFDRSVAFDITVAGVPAGAATLGLTADGGPVERRQTVAFPTGEMRVVERYRAVDAGS